MHIELITEIKQLMAFACVTILGASLTGYVISRILRLLTDR